MQAEGLNSVSIAKHVIDHEDVMFTLEYICLIFYQGGKLWRETFIPYLLCRSLYNYESCSMTNVNSLIERPSVKCLGCPLLYLLILGS